MHPPYFLIHSKPILPLPLQIPNHSNPHVKDMQCFPPQIHNPDESFHPSSIVHNVTSGGLPPQSQHQLHNLLQNWPENTNSNSGYSYDALPAPHSIHHPGLPSSEPASFQDNGRKTFDGVAKQTARKRTAQACEKCRNRKTKCTGERPACQRCSVRGLICNYTGGRLRGPSKARLRGSVSATDLRFASDEALMPDLALPSKSAHRHVSAASLPTSLPGSPIHGTWPLPNVYPRPPAREYQWRDAMSIARDLRRVQSHSILGSTGAQPRMAMLPSSASCDLTPRPDDMARSTFDSRMDLRFFTENPFGLQRDRVDHMSDSSGSEPPSATESHFSFSSASPEGGRHSRCGSSQSVDSMYNIGRAATPVYIDSHASSPASACLSSAPSPSSRIWAAELEPCSQHIEAELPYPQAIIPIGSQLLQGQGQVEGVSAGAESPHCYYLPSETFEDYKGESGHEYPEASPLSSSMISQYLDSDQVDGINWDTFTFSEER